jgi:ankyrin repeat protein
VIFLSLGDILLADISYRRGRGKEKARREGSRKRKQVILRMAELPFFSTRPLREDEKVPVVNDINDLKLFYRQNCNDEATMRRILPTLSPEQCYLFLIWSYHNVPLMRIIKDFVTELTDANRRDLLDSACTDANFPNNIELLRFLFEELHIDANQRDWIYGGTMFEEALRKCNYDTIVCFLEHGADPNQNVYGTTPFQYLILYRREEEEELFYKFFLHGADIHAKNGKGNNIFQLCFGQKPFYAALAFRLGIEDVRSPLPWLRNLHADIVSFLIKVNDEVNRRDLEDNMKIDAGVQHRFLRAFLQQNADLPYFAQLQSSEAANTVEFAALVRSLLPPS